MSEEENAQESDNEAHEEETQAEETQAEETQEEETQAESESTETTGVNDDQSSNEGPSLVDQLQEPESMRWLKYNVVLLAAVGVGYSLAFLLFDAFLPAAEGAPMEEFISAMIAMMGLVGGLSVGVVLAAINGIRIGKEFDVEQNLALANSFVGATIGFIVMAILMGMLLGDGGSGDTFTALIGFAIGVGITGALATYVVREF